MAKKRIIDDKGRFLNFVAYTVNGWRIAYCPEFEVIAGGNATEDVKEKLFEMIIQNAQIFVGKKEAPANLKVYSEQVLKNKDNLSSLFIGL